MALAIAGVGVKAGSYPSRRTTSKDLRSIIKHGVGIGGWANWGRGKPRELLESLHLLNSVGGEAAQHLVWHPYGATCPAHGPSTKG
jgi:hypothetical protein